MRVRRVKIEKWKCLQAVDIEVSSGTNLVALVGENGTGKSSVLELLSTCAQRLGVHTHMTRPLPAGHSIEVEIELSDHDLVGYTGFTGNRILTIASCPEIPAGIRMSFGGEHPTDLTHSHPLAFEHPVVAHLRGLNRTLHLRFGADRTFPSTPPNQGRIIQQLSQPALPNFGQYGLSSLDDSQPAAAYEEWRDGLIASEHSQELEHMASVRRARRNQETEPTFDARSADFEADTHNLLTHLQFVAARGLGGQSGIFFDTGVEELEFVQLSSGEKETLFLAGQLRRFNIDGGLLLIDEPELHLNQRLLEKLLNYVQAANPNGQIWFATHSVDVANFCGPESTYIFRRDIASGTVKTIRPLAREPMIALVSSALGASAFSITGTTFVFVEGEPNRGERQLYRELTGFGDDYSFVEVGGCESVLAKFRHSRQLADDVDNPLQIGAVIDADFRSQEEIDLFTAMGLHVLKCHEVENLLLDPQIITAILSALGMTGVSAADAIRLASDHFASAWVVDAAAAAARSDDATAGRLGQPLGEMRRPFADTSFDELQASFPTLVERSAEICEETFRELWVTNLEAAFDDYRNLRESDELWKRCLGKETLKRLAFNIGLSDTRALQRAAIASLKGGAAPRSEPLAKMIDYTSSLRSGQRST